MTADPTNKRRPADAWPAKHACIDRKLSMRAQKMAELPRQETLDAPRPRWGEETLDRIAAVYEAERAKQGNPDAAWADLPIEARLVLIGVYCAGRVDGGH
jgi:hypothetical protein